MAQRNISGASSSFAALSSESQMGGESESAWLSSHCLSESIHLLEPAPLPRPGLSNDYQSPAKCHST